MGAVTEAVKKVRVEGRHGVLWGGDRGCGEQVVRRGQHGKVMGRAGHSGGAIQAVDKGSLASSSVWSCQGVEMPRALQTSLPHICLPPSSCAFITLRGNRSPGQLPPTPTIPSSLPAAPD